MKKPELATVICVLDDDRAHQLAVADFIRAHPNTAFEIITCTEDMDNPYRGLSRLEPPMLVLRYPGRLYRTFGAEAPHGSRPEPS